MEGLPSLDACVIADDKLVTSCCMLLSDRETPSLHRADLSVIECWCCQGGKPTTRVIEVSSCALNGREGETRLRVLVLPIETIIAGPT